MGGDHAGALLTDALHREGIDIAALRTVEAPPVTRSPATSLPDWPGASR